MRTQQQIGRAAVRMRPHPRRSCNTGRPLRGHPATPRPPLGGHPAAPPARKLFARAAPPAWMLSVLRRLELAVAVRARLEAATQARARLPGRLTVYSSPRPSVPARRPLNPELAAHPAPTGRTCPVLLSRTMDPGAHAAPARRPSCHIRR